MSNKTFKCPMVERKESFPYGARLDRKTYWRLIDQSVDVRTSGDQIYTHAGWVDIDMPSGRCVWVQWILYRRRVRRE